MKLRRKYYIVLKYINELFGTLSKVIKMENDVEGIDLWRYITLRLHYTRSGSSA